MSTLLKTCSSITFGVTLLGIIAAACIYGSILASDTVLGATVASKKVFHSWWFVTLELLLAMNVLLCSGKRILRAPFLFGKKDFRKQKAFYEASSLSKTIHSTTHNLTGIEEELSRDFTVCNREGNTLYAQKGILGALGAPLVHTGILIILVGGFFRFLLSHSGSVVTGGRVMIPEEGSVREFTLRRRGKVTEEMHTLRIPFGFEIICRDFDTETFPGTDVPQSFASEVEVIDEGRRFIHTITMTSPLRYKAFNIHQIAYRKNPSETRYLVDLHPRGNYKEMIRIDAGVGKSVRIPGEDIEIVLDEIDEMTAPTYSGRFQSRNEGLKGAQDSEVGKVNPRFVEMITGKTLRDSESPFTATIAGMTPAYVTILGVSRDPTVWTVYLGSILILFGSIAAFSFLYRQLWALYDDKDNVLYIAIQGKGDQDRLLCQIDDISDRISR